MGGGFESRCVGRVYGADGAVRLSIAVTRRKQERENKVITVYVKE